jgi:hypothetical protein
MNKLSWIGATACTISVSAYLAYRLQSDDRTVYLPGETSYGHYQIELKCERCHAERGEVKASACMECHAQELQAADDSHPPSKFLDPRNAALIARLDARSCATCHTEHRPMLIGDMGVTVPRDYCFYCHEDIGEERPTHAGLDHDGCQAAGCHNFHDNRGLHEDFLELHLKEPALLERPLRPLRAPGGADKLLGASAADAPASARTPAAVDSWARSAHARAGVNCSGCHQGKDGGFASRASDAVCGECHAAQVTGFRGGHHGMRLAAGLDPMRPALARLPMKQKVLDRELGCHSCHAAHDYDVVTAAVDGCLECHDDRHSKAYPGSPHARAFEAERRGAAAPGSGVSCAACHMPTVPVRPGSPELFVEHNQNDNLRPNEKMVRSVCGHCHGIGFSLDALADRRLIDDNFRGSPVGQVESMDWIEKRRAERGGAAAADN